MFAKKTKTVDQTDTSPHAPPDSQPHPGEHHAFWSQVKADAVKFSHCLPQKTDASTGYATDIPGRHVQYAAGDTPHFAHNARASSAALLSKADGVPPLTISASLWPTRFQSHHSLDLRPRRRELEPRLACVSSDVEKLTHTHTHTQLAESGSLRQRAI